MTDAEARREGARQVTGRFGSQENSGPETELTQPSPLGQSIGRVHTLHDTMLDAAEEAFVAAVPDGVRRLVLHPDDGFWDVAEEWHVEGTVIDHDQDFEDLTEMLSGLGDGESGMPDFLTANRDGSYTWVAEVNRAPIPDREGALGRFERESTKWKTQRERTEVIAALTIRQSMPLGADKLVFGWSDQGPHLALDAAYDAGGNKLDLYSDEDDGFFAERYEDISFLSSNIGQPKKAGLTKLGGGQWEINRRSFVVTAAEGEQLRLEAESARAGTVDATDRWDAEAAAEYAEARAALTRIEDGL